MLIAPRRVWQKHIVYRHGGLWMRSMPQVGTATRAFRGWASMLLTAGARVPQGRPLSRSRMSVPGPQHTVNKIRIEAPRMLQESKQCGVIDARSNMTSIGGQGQARLARSQNSKAGCGVCDASARCAWEVSSCIVLGSSSSGDRARA